MSKTRIFKAIGALLLLALIAWSVKVFVFPAKRTPLFGPQEVQVTKATSEDWQQKLAATGTLYANEGVTVSPETTGIVTGILFQSGDYVEKGTPLVQLDPSIAQANLASTQALIPLRENEYKRALDLYKKKVGSKQDLDTAESNLETAKASLQSAQATLDLKTITAPFSGQLGLRQIDLGQYLNAGTAIVNLEAIDPMRVEFTLPQRFVPLIENGQKVTMVSDAYPGRTFTGEVYATDSALDLNTRSIGIWASVPNEDHSLVPGSFVNVILYVGKPQPSIVIPQQAVVYNDVSDFVYKVDGNKAVKTDIKIIQTEDKWVSVSGINADDVVVISGQNKLSDGVDIKPMTADGQSSSTADKG